MISGMKQRSFGMVDTNSLASEVQDLVWALVDEQATDEQVRRLEELLLRSNEARTTYVRCMQMHADLRYMFGGRPSPSPKLPQETPSAGLSMEEEWSASGVAVEV
jgi:hypothetical protein